MPGFVRTLVALPLLALLLVAAPALLLSSARHPAAALAQTVPPPTPLPTATPADLRVRAGGALLKSVIGDRLSDTIYGYTDTGRLVRSDNNGVSWRVAAARPQVEAFLMSPADPDLLYAGGPLACLEGAADAGTAAGGEQDFAPLPFQRSLDGGATFTATTALTLTVADGETALQPMILHPTEPETVIAAGCTGLYASYDGGATWSVLSRTGVDGIPDDFVVQEIAAAYAAIDPEAPTLDILYAVASDAAGRSLVLASNDEGRTWAVITPDVSDVTFRIRALTADPATEGRLWFAASSGVWSTADMGLFWGLSNRGLPAGDVLNDIVFHPRRILLVATDDGLYGRGTPINLWSPLGDDALQSRAIASLLFTDGRPNRIWLNAADGVYLYTLE